MKSQSGQAQQDHEPTHSRAFILRIWCVGEPQAGEWHASLEDAFSKERFGFSGLEQMFAFLMELSEGGKGGR